VVQLQAVLSIQSVLDQSFWIELVQDQICIAFLTGSEDDDFEVFVHPLEETKSVGTYGDISFLSLIDLDLNITLVGIIEVAVNQSLIHIDDQHLFMLV
jgi:hypothetical protein